MTAASSAKPVVAIIPARAGSKRIPGKNIKIFNGVPMIGRSIEIARRSRLFDRIVVSTDSDEIAAIARDFGAECPFRRPEELADDRAPTAPVIHHALRSLAAESAPAEYACCIYPAAPFIRSADLRAGLELITRHGCGSVFTVSRFGSPIFRALRLTETGSLEMAWPEYRLTRSQDLPEAFQDAGQFYWVNVPRFIEEPTLYFDDARPLIVPRWRVQDIDTPEDWDRAELMYKVMAEQGLLE